VPVVIELPCETKRSPIGFVKNPEDLFNTCGSLTYSAQEETDLEEQSNKEKDTSNFEIENKAKELPSRKDKTILTVGDSTIIEIVSQLTKIPVELLKKGSKRLLKLEAILHNRIVGQNEAVIIVARAIRRARSGLKNPNRPIAVLFFAGTTGVGKTELAKALAEQYFGTKEAILRYDMSEYQATGGLNKLIGAARGYIGYEEGGLLTNGIRQKPSSLVLFDEFEKSYNGVFDLMLQVFDEGRLTDSKGDIISFSQAIVILTSNAGVTEINKLVNEARIKSQTLSYKNLAKSVKDTLKNRFRTEFLNRIDDITVFRPLTKAEVAKISEIMLTKLKKKLKKKENIEVSVSERAKDFVVKEGYDPQYGARPLRRAFTHFLENPIITKLQDEENEFNFLKHKHLFVDLDSSRNITVINLVG